MAGNRDTMWSHASYELKKMLELIYETPRGHFLEIGAHMFNMSIALYLTSAKRGKVVTIDPKLKSPERLEIMKMYAGDRFTFLEGLSTDQPIIDKVHELAKDKLFDLILVDGNHTYEGIKTDTELYADLISPKGYIVWHDFFTIGENCESIHGRFQGVNTYINELRDKGIPVKDYLEETSCIAYIKGDEWISSQK